MKLTAVKKKPFFRIVLFLIMTTLLGCEERALKNTTVQIDAEQKFLIRILLLDGVTSVKLSIPSGFTVINPKAKIPQADFEQSADAIEIKISNGKINMAGWSFDSNEITIFPDKPHIFNINGNDYRGKLKLVINSDTNSFDAVNLLGLESYLTGVIGAEMPNYWEPQALMAQTIAARTYCLYIKKRFGQKHHWDLRKTQAHQTYRGIKAESKQIFNVVNKTWGQTLICKQPDGTTDIFPAYYSSSCGGHTENSKNIFGGKFFEPLDGTPCPYCKHVAKKNFYKWPTVEFKKNTVSAKLLKRYPSLKKLVKITAITAFKQSDYDNCSRITMIKLIGSNGKSDFLRAEDLRLAIDPTGMKIKSTIFKIVDKNDKWAFEQGRGFGHGVGMCQCGAQQLARLGKTAEEILSFYYHGSEIKNIYDE